MNITFIFITAIIVVLLLSLSYKLRKIITKQITKIAIVLVLLGLAIMIDFAIWYIFLNGKGWKFNSDFASNYGNLVASEYSM